MVASVHTELTVSLAFDILSLSSLRALTVCTHLAVRLTTVAVKVMGSNMMDECQRNDIEHTACLLETVVVVPT